MDKETVEEVAKNMQPVHEQEGRSVEIVEKSEDERPLTEKEKTWKRIISSFCYGVSVWAVLFFFGKGGFSLSIWWWIVVAFMVLLAIGIYGTKEENTKSSFDGVIGIAIMSVLGVFLMGNCMGEGSSSSGGSGIEVSRSEERNFSSALSRYYPNFKEIVSIKKVDEGRYKFTILQRNSGVTYKQDGFLSCYEDGEVYQVSSYGNPYDFIGSDGKPMHDKSGAGLY